MSVEWFVYLGCYVLIFNLATVINCRVLCVLDNCIIQKNNMCMFSFTDILIKTRIIDSLDYRFIN